MERRIKVGDELWLLVKSTVGDGDIPLKAELVFQGASTGICIGGEDCFDVDGVHLGMKYRATRDSEVLAAEGAAPGLASGLTRGEPGKP